MMAAAAASSGRRFVEADDRVVVVVARRLAERADELLEGRLVELGLQGEVAERLPGRRDALLALVDLDRRELETGRRLVADRARRHHRYSLRRTKCIDEQL